MCDSIRLYLRNGRWTEPAPRFRPNGHRLGAGRSLVSVLPCRRIGGHHRTHTCLACAAITYCPPIHADCEHQHGTGRIPPAET
ncbi:hypothetical protein [Nocardia alba]|uniref:hypothetical protein n=1 Tax=Nocardia alba TaxID=225051 RepID=UPI00082F2C41|nr:hypothetical protein [Nocardia alba]